MNDMHLTATSLQNMLLAESWDAWALDPGPGFHVVLYLRNRTSIIHRMDNGGPVVFPTEAEAAEYMAKNAAHTVRRRPAPARIYTGRNFNGIR